MRSKVQVARFSAANRDGTSVFRRFALPDSADLRERRGESGRVGAAVWGEPRLREEDSQTSVALRARGTSLSLNHCALQLYTCSLAYCPDPRSGVPLPGDTYLIGGCSFAAVSGFASSRR